jgi:uncharacterized heparinase superfamily protein
MMLLTYFHTIKHLKFAQIYYRLIRRFTSPKVHELKAIRAESAGTWISQSLYQQKLFAGNAVSFLNHQSVINQPSDWNNERQSKLWLYNLHYFDDLSAMGAESRRLLQKGLMLKWIDENPAPFGNGWEPYPTSLRIVNWIKGLLSGIEGDQTLLNSLVKQTDFLSQHLERHILANHLFANAKALIFAGTYFEGKEAKTWLEIGLKIYKRELGEQVLADGGHFELSPMYHVIMLIDLLDLINLWSAYPNKVDSTVIDEAKQVAMNMLHWLAAMSHNDGDISFFNDAAFSIAPKNKVVFEYAKKLAIKVIQTKHHDSASLTIDNLENSGYISVKSAEYSLIVDLASVGASYQPAHGHADTLSFEFALDGQRIFVNSGISEYGVNEERLRQRKSAAHNSVVVNGLDSSQVWSGFRVAKRAKVLNKTINPIMDNSVQFSASHNGFKQQGVNCLHHRAWRAEVSTIKIVDKLIGHFKSAIGYLHLHPNIEVLRATDEEIILQTMHYQLVITVNGAKVSIENTTWHPEFGVSTKNKKLCFSFTSHTVTLAIRWQKYERT